MNYFDQRITNAHTESLNNLTRSVMRQGRGYSFEVIRAKMLFSEGVRVVRKNRKKKFPKRWGGRSTTSFDSNVVYHMPVGGFGQEPERLELDFGASISTLIALAEKGEL